MAIPFDRLRARIGCCRVALADAADGPALQFISTTQRKVLIDMFPRCHLDTEQRAVIVGDLSKCAFAEQDQLELLTLAAGAKPKNTGEKLPQDYLAYPTYMPDSLQDWMLDPNRQMSEKTSLLFTLMGQLGMRRGDEFTMKRMTSDLLVHSKDADSLRLMTPRAKWLVKNELKRQ